MDRGAGSKPYAPSPNFSTAVQSEVYSYLAENGFYLILCDVINYNDVIFAADLYE